MSWDGFAVRWQAPAAAFEALCMQIFERWSRREYGTAYLRTWFLEGRGGDGGVEAFTELVDGRCVGLQAKWFRDPMRDGQVKQVQKSLAQASARHPRLSRYIVCVPHDISDAKSKREKKSERDRWVALEGWSRRKHKDVALERWGETAILDQLQKVDEGIRAYWFESQVIQRASWQSSYDTAKSTWLKNRYLPDLHCSGRIEQAISWHRQTWDSRTDWIGRAESSIATLEEAAEEVSQLPRYASVMALPENVLRLAREVEADLPRVAIGLRQAVLGLQTGLQVIPEPVPRVSIQPLWDLNAELRRFVDANRSHRYGPIGHLLRTLRRVYLEGDAIFELGERLQTLPRLLVIAGEPGIGKTHAAAAAVGEHFSAGGVGLLVPARSVDPGEPLAAILNCGLDRPTWNAGQVLDALESATIHCARRLGLPAEDAEQRLPARALLVIDGLEESTHSARWKERLGELCSMLLTRPRVAAVALLRTGSVRRCLPDDEAAYHLLAVEGQSDPDLHELFGRYCGPPYNVQVDDAARWVPDVLRSPLAVRLFAEEYRGRRLERDARPTTSVHVLVKRKLARLDEEMAEGSSRWVTGEDRSLRVLREFSQAVVARDRPLTKKEALDLINGALASVGGSDPADIERFIAKASDEYGLIDSWRIDQDEPLVPDEHVFGLAANQMTDILIADKCLGAVQEAIAKQQEPEYPTVLSTRPDAAPLLVGLLADQGVFIAERGYWKKEVPEADRVRWQLRALVDSPVEECARRREWVAGLLVTSMPFCRMVLAELVVPVARWGEHPLGVRMVHEILLPLRPAQRDVFWSGPDSLRVRGAGPWEGEGEPVWERIVLRDDDVADGLPLLLGWGCASVVRNRRLLARHKLALWGAKRLAEMARLLDDLAVVSDPQVVEDLMIAAAGASMRCEYDDKDLITLAQKVDELLFADQPRVQTDDAVVRHAARVVVERAAVLGHPVQSDALTRARPRRATESRLLPIDGDAVGHASGRNGASLLLWMDLGWYVGKRATDDFFKDASPSEREPRERMVWEVPAAVQQAARDGRLGKDIQDIWNEVDRILDEQVEVKSDEELTTRLAELEAQRSQTQQVAPESARPVRCWRGAVLSSEPPVPGTPVPEPVHEYTAEATDLLRQYGAHLGRTEPLTAEEFTAGVLEAHARDLGWNEAVFMGAPGDKKPGMDTAIRDRFHPASQGSHSAVAAVAEKYVWSGVNTVAGYLAARLPFVDDDGTTRWLDDWSELGSGMPEPFMPDPADDVPDDEDEEPDGRRVVPVPIEVPAFPPWYPGALLPTVSVSAPSQPERAIEWLARAPWPTPSKWISDGHFGSDRLVLWAEISHLDLEHQVVVVAWINAFCIKKKNLDLLVRDAKKIGKAAFEPHIHLHEIRARVGDGDYASPSISAWAPWCTDLGETEYYTTVDEDGIPVDAPLSPLTSEVMWEQGEQRAVTIQAPVSWLRRALRVVDALGGGQVRRFTDRRGFDVAYFQQSRFPRYSEWANEVLVGDKSRVLRAVRGRRSLLAWSVRVFRRPGRHLLEPRDARQHEQERFWFILWDEAKAKPTVVELAATPQALGRTRRARRSRSGLASTEPG